MRYKNLETGEIVKVTQENDSFYTLNNGVKIAKKLFSQKFSIINENVITESVNNIIDADSFLNTPTNIKVATAPQTATQRYTVSNQAQDDISAVNPDDFFNSSKINISGIDNIMRLDSSKIVDVPKEMSTIVRDVSNEPIQQMNISSNLENEKRLLLENYNKTHNINKNDFGGSVVDENDDNATKGLLNTMQPQTQVSNKPKLPLNENGLTEYEEIYRKQQIDLIGEDPYINKIKKYKEEQRLNKIYNMPLNDNTVSNPLNDNIPSNPINNASQSTISNITQRNTVTDDVDDSYKMFKTFKRNYDISININIDDKISKPEFIKIMADGLEGDIVQYYSEEILKKILSDIPLIQKKIYDQIYKEVYGDFKKTEASISDVKQEIPTDIKENDKVSE